MQVLAVIGWIVLMGFSMWVLAAATWVIVASRGFTGRTSWGGIASLLLGVGMFVGAIAVAPFHVALS